MYIKLKRRSNSDTILNKPHHILSNMISIIEVGHSTPPAGYNSNSLTRNQYVIHYVISGKGTFAGKEISAPCIFVRFPFSEHYFSVDSSEEAPQWEHYWIKFSGIPSQNIIENLGISPDLPIAPCNYINQAVEIFKTLQNSFSYKHKNDQFVMLSNLFMLLSLHNVSDTRYDDIYSPYTRITCDYIHENYASIINEAELAKVAHISINHLIRVFKADMNMTPYQYLMNYRIKKAQKLLQSTELSISAIAESVGFLNPTYFCNVFKRYSDAGLPPKKYREKITQEKLK